MDAHGKAGKYEALWKRLSTCAVTEPGIPGADTAGGAWVALLHSQLCTVLQNFWHTTSTTLFLQVWLLFISFVWGTFVRIYFPCLHSFIWKLPRVVWDRCQIQIWLSKTRAKREKNKTQNSKNPNPERKHLLGQMTINCNKEENYWINEWIWLFGREVNTAFAMTLKATAAQSSLLRVLCRSQQAEG